MPWVSYVFIRILPERTRYLTAIGGEGISALMPIGYVLALEQRGNVSISRLAGGFGIPSDQTPLATAMLRVYDDIGINIPKNRIYFLDKWLGHEGTSCWKHYYCADIYESEADKIDPRHRGMENGRPLRLLPEDLAQWVDHRSFSAKHRVRLEMAGLLPKVILGTAVQKNGPAA